MFVHVILVQLYGRNTGISYSCGTINKREELLIEHGVSESLNVAIFLVIKIEF